MSQRDAERRDFEVGLGPLAIASALTDPTTDEDRSVFEALRDSVRKLSQTIDPDLIDRDGRIPAAVIEGARRAGLFALSIGEPHGGLGLSLKSCCGVIDELARIDRSVAVMVGLHAGLGTAGLTQFGNAEQHARWLPRLASGEDIASFCATEPGAGSDLMGIRTTATLTDRGDLRISGEKAYVTNGGFAGVYTLLVKTPQLGGARAQSLVCVRSGTPGLTVGAEEHKLGIRGSSTVSLHLDDVIVPREAIIGDEGRGSQHVEHVLAWGRTLMSAGCLGTARTALAKTLDHVMSRRQFGRTLWQMPLVKADCVRMASSIHAMESLIRATACVEHDAPRLSLLSTSAKVFCSETTFAICDRGIQLHGAHGFLEPSGMPRLLRDCRVTRIFEGANDVLCVRSGAALLTMKPTDSGPSHDRHAPGREAECLRSYDALVREQAATHAELRKRYGVSVMQQQSVLWLLGRAEAWRSAAEACLVRCEAEADERTRQLGEHAARDLIEESTAYLRQARAEETPQRQRQVTDLADRLWPATSATPPSAPSPGARSQELVP